MTGNKSISSKGRPDFISTPQYLFIWFQFVLEHRGIPIQSSTRSRAENQLRPCFSENFLAHEMHINSRLSPLFPQDIPIGVPADSLVKLAHVE